MAVIPTANNFISFAYIKISVGLENLQVDDPMEMLGGSFPREGAEGPPLPPHLALCISSI